jgi:hypothetical protein
MAYVPSSRILVTLMKEALSSPETSVLIRATRRNIPEDAILQDYTESRHDKFLLQLHGKCTGVGRQWAHRPTNVYGGEQNDVPFVSGV